MNQTSLTDESKPEGRIYNLYSYIKRLVLEDPLNGIITILITIPVGTAIASSALLGHDEILPLLIAVLSGTVLAVQVPLIMTKTWKMNQREIAKQKGIAIASEAKRRVTREEHKQQRLDDLIDAKIRSLEAQTTYLLDKSASYEKQMLLEALAEVKAVFRTNNELAKVQGEFDDVLESLDRIEKGISQESEPPADIEIQDTVALDETDYKALYDQKLADIESLREQGGEMQTELTRLATENEQLQKEIADSKLEIKTTKLEAKLDAATEEPMPSEDEMKEALRVVDGLEDEAEEAPQAMPTYWNCPSCERGNDIKKNRCPKCGTTKPPIITSTNA